MVELDVTHLAVGGAGIGRAPDGRVVLCEGALPGERVEAQITDERRDFVRARHACGHPAVAVAGRAGLPVRPGRVRWLYLPVRPSGWP